MNILKIFKSRIKEPDEKILDDSKTTYINDEVEPETREVDSAKQLFSLGFNHSVNDVHNMISLYREVAMNHNVNLAVIEIKNEAIVNDRGSIVELDLEKVNLNENVKKVIKEEFKNILNMYSFKNKADEYFEQWYVDSRIYVHHILENTTNKPKIIGLQILDPLKLERFKSKENGKYYYYYKSDLNNNFTNPYTTYNNERKEYVIPEDQISFITSGITNEANTRYISYLERSIKPLNLLTLVEDSAAIYRITRAPERRVFNIETDGLPTKKANAFARKMINKLKGEVVFDATYGNVRQNKKVLTMLEDYFFIKGKNGKGTTVESLRGGQQLGEITDIKYLKDNLLRSLYVPTTRYETSSTGGFYSHATDIQREEIRFSRFTDKLKVKFSPFLLNPLKYQLLYKKIINYDEWDDIATNSILNWKVDSYFAELKEQSILQKRIETADSISAYIGKIYSIDFVKREIFKMSEDDIKDQNSKIEEEKKLGLYDDIEHEK